jgi:tellurite resistance protein TerB
MSILADKAREMLAHYTGRTRDRAFLEAAMAASALVAAADGEVALAELHSRDEVLDRIDALQAFDASDAVAVFRGYVSAIETDHDAGVKQALAAVARVGSEPGQAALLMRVAVAIAKADARFSPEEQAVIVQLAESLGAESIDMTADPQ